MPKKVHDAIHPRQVNSLPVGKHCDGAGLYLYVQGEDARSWVWRGSVNGRRREVSIGPASLVSLKEARETALEWGRMAFRGEDPREARDERKRQAMTFEEAARHVHAENVVPSVAPGSSHRWIRSLEIHAFPILGPLPVSQVTQADVLRVLSPIWTAQNVTAKLVRQRIAQTLDWARTAGLRDGENPCHGVAAGLANARHKVTHRAALPWQEVPAAYARITEVESVAAKAIAFQILTGARPSEARGARWEEIDLESGLWTIPPRRMKARRQHVVPLSPEAMDVLRSVGRLNAKFVFPGHGAAKPVGGTTLADVLRRLGLECTPHGFRSSFADWAEERGGVRSEVAEMCLAHTIGTATQRAYRRADVLEERREALARWARFLAPTEAKVVGLR